MIVTSTKVNASILLKNIITRNNTCIFRVIMIIYRTPCVELVNNYKLGKGFCLTTKLASNRRFIIIILINV